MITDPVLRSTCVPCGSRHFQHVLYTTLAGVGDDGGEEGAGDGASPCPASLCLSASSVAPSNWLKEDQVLALLLMTVTKRLVGTGLGRGGGGNSGAVAGGGACWGPAGALATPGVAHMLIHSGVKQFTCKQCGYNCARATNLKQHICVHSGEKPFSCQLQ